MAEEDTHKIEANREPEHQASETNAWIRSMNTTHNPNE